MRAVFKLLCVLCAVFALLSFSVFSVNAASGLVKWNTDYVAITSCQIGSGGSFRPCTSYSFTTESGTNRGCLSIQFSSTTYNEWSATFQPLDTFPSYVVSDRFMQLSLSIYYWNMVGGSSYGDQVITGALYLTTPDGTIYEFPITDQTTIGSETGVSTTSYLLTIGGIADVAQGFDLKDCTYQFVANGVTNLSGVSLYFGALDFSFVSKVTDDTVEIVDSVEQGFADLQNRIDQSAQDIIDNQNQNTQDIINNQNSNTDKITQNQDSNTDEIIGNQNANTDKITQNQDSNTDEIIGNQNANADKITQNQDSNTDEIIGNQNANADKITQNQDANTDKIVNGWDSEDDTAGKTDEAVGSLGSAEDEALGGKSDDEIKAEVDNALGQVTFPDQNPDNIVQVGVVFNKLLDSFGMQYQSVLILALSLGLGAFLVGRQYNAKG